MRVMPITLDDGSTDKVEVPDTGDDLYDEAVALLNVAGTSTLKARAHVDRVCGIIARRFVAPDIAADQQKWKDWQRKLGIKRAPNAKSIFQPVLKAMSGKTADTTGFISQAAHALTEWDEVHRNPQSSDDPDRPTPEEVEADRVAEWMGGHGGYAGICKIRRARLQKLNPPPTKEQRKSNFRKLIEDCQPLQAFGGLGDVLRQYDGYYCALIQIHPHSDALTILAPGEQPDQGWLERNAGRLIDTLPQECLPPGTANELGMAAPSAHDASIDGRHDADAAAALQESGATESREPEPVIETPHFGDDLEAPSETHADNGALGLPDAEVMLGATSPDRQDDQSSSATGARSEVADGSNVVSGVQADAPTIAAPICKLGQCQGYAMCSATRCGAVGGQGTTAIGAKFVLVGKVR